MASQAQIDALMASAQQIKAGVDSLSAKGAPASGTPASNLADQFIQGANAQSGIISSSEKDVTKLIQDAQATIKSGAESGAKAIESQYDRLAGYQATANDRLLTDVRASQRGFATNTALLAQIKESGDKSLNDLEQRKQELIMQGNSNAAQQISTLQVQEAQFMVQSRQQVFTNLVSLAGIGQQAQSLELQKANTQQQADQFDQTLQTKAAEIALQYGINMSSTDTVASVVSKASGKAGALFDLSLQDAVASLKLKDAQTALVRAQSIKESGGSVNDYGAFFDSIDLLGGVQTEDGRAVFNSMSGLAQGDTSSWQKFSASYAKYLQPRDVGDDVLIQSAQLAHGQGGVFSAFLEDSITNNPRIKNKARAEELARLIFSKPKQAGRTPIGIMPPGSWATNAPPYVPASPEAVQALRNSLKVGGFGISTR